MIHIRPAEPKDAEAITCILNQIIRDTTITFNSVEKTPDDVAQSISDADAYFVAEADGQIVGYASFAPFRKGVGYGDVKEHSICIGQDARAKGLGSKLLFQIEETARQQGVMFMVAGVSGENEAGLQFHTKHGYTRTGHMPEIGQKFGRRLDLILMQKTL